jgi:DNA-binding NarL/FixJ family response regulator
MGERTSAEASVNSVSGKGQVPHFGRRRMRAVVADGSSDWRSIVTALLKMEDDVEVVAHVKDGQEAIEAVTVLHPELAIIDLRIGSLDALTTTSLLRHQFPLLDVVLMADRDSPRLRATCKASGTRYVVQRAKFHEQFPPVLAQIRNCLGSSAVVCNDAK